MELSLDMPNLDHQLNALVKDEDCLSMSPTAPTCRPVFKESSPEILDLSKITFEDDENWLVESSIKSVPDLHKWLYSKDNCDDLVAHDYNNETSVKSKSDFQKDIDTRTFTRPKKRLARPNIEKYNEELFRSDNLKDSFYSNNSNKLIDSGIQINGCSQEDSTENTPTKPLHFDLTQPIASHYFDNILASASMADSFQNMSPPSLVNSMCSSTFANLMESSFIKNDPVLREISRTDYTDSVLLQDTEPLLYQSVTESCCSINSDAAENFLKRSTVHETFKKSLHNATFDKKDFDDNNSDDEMFKSLSVEDINIKENKEISSPVNLNGTYQRKLRPTSTFRVADLNNGTITLKNATFQKINSSDNSINTTITLKPDSEILSSTTKRLLDRRPSPSLDLNHISNEVKRELSPEVFNKRNSYGSTDSTENLDYMSLSSGSSKSSHKLPTMEGINAIIEMQEKSLQQVISTPKHHYKTRPLWDSVVSPISGRNSDPELSSIELTSNDEPVLINATITKQKSLGNINSMKYQPRLSRLQTMATNIRGSHPNLKIQPHDNNKTNQNTKTNLKSMGHTLKGSYTSLKPMNRNLPVAPPLDSTITTAVNTTRVIVPPIPVEDVHFVKPQPPRASGLPRPVNTATGIPRPLSRIPGPRSLRAPTKSSAQQGR